MNAAHTVQSLQYSLQLLAVGQICCSSLTVYCSIKHALVLVDLCVWPQFEPNSYLQLL